MVTQPKAHVCCKSMTSHLAYITPDEPGVGGSIKNKPEDFIVEEIPLYIASEIGKHLYLFVEKREQTTTDAARQIARLFSVNHKDVGFAGLKDKHAITRQVFSVPITNEDSLNRRIKRFQYTNLKLIWHKRHSFPIRRGHLLGNRFWIRIRDVDTSTSTEVLDILKHLEISGVPNFVGDQRFGYRQSNHELGRLLLLGQWELFLNLLLGQPVASDYEATRIAREAYERGDLQAAIDAWPRHLRHDRQALDTLRQGKLPIEAVMAIDRQQRMFLASSFQSAIFNAVLDQRIRNKQYDTLLDGDVAWIHEDRTTFPVNKTIANQENQPGSPFSKIHISPTGPMWGPNMPLASANVYQAERQALAATGMSESDINGGSQCRAEGNRRPLRSPLKNIRLRTSQDHDGPFIEVAFDLTRGSFATIVLREIMKPDRSSDVS